jgi:superfamily II DNA or RNA helicase
VLKTELRSYQSEAVDAALQHDGFALFPEQRTGKCLIALAIVEARKPDLVVIVCPKKAHTTWESEIEKHLDLDWECAFYIINYQQPVKNLELRGHWYRYTKSFVDGGGTLMVIADESHHIKKPGTAQSRFVRTLGKRAHWRLALTGTPMDKGYEQLWSTFDFVQHKVAFGTYDQFKNRYVLYDEKERRDGRRYRTITGYQRGPELLKIIHTFSYRITFNEARIAMGKKPITIRKRKVYFDLNPKSQRLYDSMNEEMQVVIDGLTIDSPLPVTKIQKLQQICGGFLLHQQRIPGQKKRKRLIVPTGKEKLTALMQLLSGMDGRKLVICARFTHEIKAINELLDEFRWTYKEISGSSEWDNKFDTDVVVMQVRSGLGFDLSEANTYIFFSWDHSFITFEQSRFRIMSMEHTSQINYFFLMARGTIEDEYYTAVSRKKDFSTLVLDKYRKTQAAKRRGAARKNPKRVRQARKEQLQLDL